MENRSFIVYVILLIIGILIGVGIMAAGVLMSVETHFGIE